MPSRSPTTTRRARWLVVAVLVLGGGLAGKHCLIDDGAVPEAPAFALDLNALRRLAKSPAKSLPLRVNVEVVAHSIVPKGVVFAGGGGNDHIMARTAYQLVYRDGHAILDTGPSGAQHRAMPRAGPYFPEAWQRVQTALRGARLIAVTHEHPDHIGGIPASPHFDEIAKQVVLTGAQLQNQDALARVGFDRARQRKVRVTKLSEPTQLLPGVVMAPAPGHTPGSVIVFATLENGRELLFAGDIGWHHDNVARPWLRPRAVSSFIVREDRAAVAAQLRALHALERSGRIEVLLSHDAEQVARLRKQGRLGAAFE
jgi:glyoxylase-like metal-dependent hydrolase (beta-lactamase superfamily II)